MNGRSRWALALTLLLAACPDPGGDADAAADLSDLAPARVKVAAIQYGSGDHSHVDGCSDDPCALAHLVDEAAGQGAVLVVTPEYALDQSTAEPVPAVGSDSAGAGSKLVQAFGARARQHGIYLVLSLLTAAGGATHNTQVALDPDGQVVAVHHKFNLYQNEVTYLTPGTDVSVFSSPLGKIGLLICADIYGDPTLVKQLMETLQPRTVALSLFWTKPTPENAYFFFAKAYGVYLVAANTTEAPGQGGGIYDPDGQPLAHTSAQTPSVVYAELPASD